MDSENIGNAFNSCQFLFEILGMQYMSVKKVTTRNWTEKPSKLRLVFMIGMVAFIISFVLTYIIQDDATMKEVVNSKNILTFVLQRTLHFLVVVLICTSIIKSYLSTVLIKQLYLNTATLIRDCAGDFQTPFDYQKIRKRAWSKLTTMLLFLFSTHGALMVLHRNILSNVKLLLLGLIPMLFILACVFHYIFYASFLNHQLDFLMRLLHSVFDPEPQLIVVINIISKNEPLKTLETPANTATKKLKTIWKAYNTVYENGQLINRSFGFTILALLVTLVITLTNSGYELVVIIIDGLPITRLLGE